MGHMEKQNKPWYTVHSLFAEIQQRRITAAEHSTGEEYTEMKTGLYIRRAEEKDIEEALSLYERARKFMAENGNPGQWVNGYPAREDVETDVNRGVLYICESLDGMEGVFMFDMGEEPNYQRIEQGYWLNDKPYGFLHRIASAGRKKGVASFCVQWCLARCDNMRGDTHQDNIPMQRVFEKNGFIRCGIVYMKDGTQRIAYQKETG